MKKLSISVKVILIIFMLVLPINILALVSVNRAMDKVETHAELMMKNVSDVYMTDLSKKMENAVGLLFYMQSQDSNCLKLLQQSSDAYTYKSAKLKSYSGLKNMASLITGGDGYFFYMKNKEDTMAYKGTMEKEVFSELLDTALQRHTGTEEPYGGWQILEVNGNSYLCLSMDFPKYMCGTMISLAETERQIKKKLTYSSCEVTFSEEKPVKEKSKISVSSLERDIYLSIHILRNDILQEMAGYERILLMLVSICILFLPVFYILLRKMLIRPLGVINDAHHQIKAGNQDYRINAQVDSREYQEVFDSFNEMADNLNMLRIKVYEKELERQKLELRTLQLQIRPHFLLNTFNLIFTLAQIGKYEKIQESIIFLSDYFRHVFKSRELELFSKELTFMEGYKNLTSLCYEGQVEMTFDFEPEILFVRIPPLLLMNFLENAVQHGKDSSRTLHITFTGEYEDGKVIFWIIDDGNGMSEEQLRQHQRMFSGDWEPNDKSTHVGLYNAYKRMQYYYGESVVMEVDSNDRLTVFKIEIPYSLEVENETFDRE